MSLWAERKEGEKRGLRMSEDMSLLGSSKDISIWNICYKKEVVLLLH